MKIVVLQGSPNKKGSTDILVTEFTRGAEEAGHSVTRFDLADMDLNPCTGCVSCGYEGPCVLQDDNQKIRRKILDGDMIVFPPPFIITECQRSLKQRLTGSAPITAALPESI